MTDNFNNECRKSGIPIYTLVDKKPLTLDEVEIVKKLEQTNIYEVVHDLLQKIAFTLMLFEQNNGS